MKIKSNSVMEFAVYLELTEDEARALKAITAFGSKSFLEVFYKYLGKSGLEEYEKSIIALFDTIDKQLPQHLKRIDLTRNTFQVNNPNKI